MTRNLKVLVLALVAALALTAVAASSASAFTKFNSEAGTTAFKGTQKGSAELETDPGTITCTGATFRGMVTSTEQATLSTSDSTATTGGEVGKKGIEFGSCKFLGFIGVMLNNNGCQFQFHPGGTVDIINGGGTCSTEGITFNGGGCEVHIRPQTGLSGVTFVNAGSGTGRTITIDTNPLSGITYTAEGCITGGNGTHADGVYRNDKTEEGEKKPGSASVTIGGTTNTNEGMTARGIFIA